MLKIIEKQKKSVVYWGLFVLALVLYHLSIKAYFGDDYIFFSKILTDYNLTDWLQQRYEGWSSRIIIEALLVIFAREVFLWKVANFFVCLLLAYSLYKLSHGISLSAVLALVLSYPLIDMASAGWIATFMNYYWPLSFGMYSLIALDKLVRGEEIKGKEMIFSFIAAFIGVNVEQYCAIHLAFLILITISLCVNKKFHRLEVLIGHYFITCSSLLFIFTTPGNTVRKSEEVINWMKDFYEKTFLDKSIDGFEQAMSTLLSSSNVIFILFLAVLFACIWKKTKNIKYRVIGSVPLIVALVVSFGEINTNGFFSDLVNLISSNTGVTARNWVKLSSYIPVLIYVFIFTSIISSFFILFDEFGKAFECAYIFCVAIASYVVLGFSPTLFASGKRPLIFCYFLLIILILKLFEYAGELFSEREIRWGKNILWVLCSIIVLNNIACAGNVI